MRHDRALRLTSRSASRTWVLAAGCALLITGCGFPRKDHAGLPDARVIQVTQGSDGRLVARAPDCAPLLQPSQYHNVNDARPAIAFGCATYSNLAASLARPGDLISPRNYRGQHADSAVLAVERYRLNEVEPLRETLSTDIGQ